MKFRHLATSNIRGNWRQYTAFFFSSVFSVMIFFLYAQFILHPDVVGGEAAGSQLRETRNGCLRIHYRHLLLLLCVVLTVGVPKVTEQGIRFAVAVRHDEWPNPANGADGNDGYRCFGDHRWHRTRSVVLEVVFACVEGNFQRRALGDLRDADLWNRI